MKTIDAFQSLQLGSVAQQQLTLLTAHQRTARNNPRLTQCKVVEELIHKACLDLKLNPDNTSKENSNQIEQISTSTAVRMIRAELKNEFGNQTKFSVRTSRGIYPGITVAWTGSPSKERVRKLLESYQGAVNDLDFWHFRPCQIQGRLVQFEHTIVMLEKS